MAKARKKIKSVKVHRSSKEVGQELRDAVRNGEIKTRISGRSLQTILKLCDWAMSSRALQNGSYGGDTLEACFLATKAQKVLEALEVHHQTAMSAELTDPASPNGYKWCERCETKVSEHIIRSRTDYTLNILCGDCDDMEAAEEVFGKPLICGVGEAVRRAPPRGSLANPHRVDELVDVPPGRRVWAAVHVNKDDLPDWAKPWPKGNLPAEPRDD